MSLDALRGFDMLFIMGGGPLALAVCAGGVSAVLDPPLLPRYAPAAVLLVPPALVLLVASAAFAVRFRSNAAAAAAGIVVALGVPAVGNYYMADALSNGGEVSWVYVAFAALAALPAVLAFAFLGLRFIGGRDLS